MAKHDRRKTSGQPPSSQPVTIQVPLPVLGVINGVRESFVGDDASPPVLLRRLRAGTDRAGAWQLVSDNPHKQAWPTRPWPADAEIVGEVKWAARTFT